jgi:hypothetical protein
LTLQSEHILQVVTRTDVRSSLIELSRRYHEQDLGLPLAPDICLRARTGPWIEFAHTPQLPHLGVVRLLLSAAAEARRSGGVFAFCLNDQLGARELPESRYVPYCVRGRFVAKPPSFGLSKTSSVPMAILPPPAIASVDAFRTRLRELRPRGDDAWLFEAFKASAERCRSYASWITHVSLSLLGLSPLIIPTWRLAEALPVEFLQTSAKHPERFWLHCGSCGVRIGRANSYGARCPHCRDENATADRIIPDVVARQCLMNIAGTVSMRLSGREKSYQSEADTFYRDALGRTPPVRRRITGRAIAIDSSGHPIERCNLVQVLLDGSPHIFSETPPPEDPAMDWRLQLNQQ